MNLPNLPNLLSTANKPGRCPANNGQSYQCKEECQNDAHCDAELKCCYDGCGYACVKPIREEEEPGHVVQPVATPTVPGRLTLDSLMAWLLGTRIYELLLCYSYSFYFFPFFFIFSFPFSFFSSLIYFSFFPSFLSLIVFSFSYFFSIPFLSLYSLFLCPSFLSYFLSLIFFSFSFFLVHSFSFSFFPTFLFFYLFLFLVLSGVSDCLNPMHKCHSCIFFIVML